MREVRIYQTDNSDYKFMNYSWAAKHGYDIYDYDVVAEFFIPDYWGVLDEELEKIYKMGNEGIIQQMKGVKKMRSISVSDVIEIDGKKYYVDSLGFKEVGKWSTK